MKTEGTKEGTPGDALSDLSDSTLIRAHARETGPNTTGRARTDETQPTVHEYKCAVQNVVTSAWGQPLYPNVSVSGEGECNVE